jgi:S1-C subfamily serine protease
MSTDDFSLRRPSQRRAINWSLVLLIVILGLVVLRQLGDGFREGGRDPLAAPRETEPAAVLAEEEQATIKLFQNVSPAVVHINTLAVRRSVFELDATQVQQGLGSGFLWDEQGHVVTNYHVIEGANSAQVVLNDQSTWDAELVGVEPDKDMAVLKIAAPRDKLRSIRLGTSGDLQVGQNVFAIGNPFGLDQTLTKGIISGLGREIESSTGRPIQGVIQTDAAINPGNSGGPLLDSGGRLIGMNTGLVSPSGAYAGVGFAVPVDTINRIVPQLIRDGRVQRAGLGVAIAEDQITRRLGLKGALVLRVAPGSGAEAAGMRSTRYNRNGDIELGDLIVAIEGRPVEEANDVYRHLEDRQPGETVAVSIRRDDGDATLRVKLQAVN